VAKHKATTALKLYITEKYIKYRFWPYKKEILHFQSLLLDLSGVPSKGALPPGSVTELP
jgi:hypothetical protein